MAGKSVLLDNISPHEVHLTGNPGRKCDQNDLILRFDGSVISELSTFTNSWLPCNPTSTQHQRAD